MEGKSHLAQFIVNRGKAKVEEAMKTGWEIENSEQTLIGQRMSRMDIFYEAIAWNIVRGVVWRWHWIFCKETTFKETVSVLQCADFWKREERNIVTFFSMVPQIAINLFY